MKYKMFVPLTAGLALVLALTASRPFALVSARLQATDVSRTPMAVTNQCTQIDALVVNSLATPGTTQAATRSVVTQPAVNPTAASVNPTASPVVEGGAGESGGGDEALTAYRDNLRKFVIGYPRSWSQEPTFKNGVCFTGRDASIAVQFVPGSVPADLMAYVKADEAKIQAGSPGYKGVYLKASTEVKGAIILGYEWDAGKSSVTEKPVRARSDRYYLVDSAGRLVIITETEPIKQFDPDGVRDTALTYQVTK